METPGGLVAQVTRWRCTALAWMKINRYVSSVQAIKAADVKSFAGDASKC